MISMSDSEGGTATGAIDSTAAGITPELPSENLSHRPSPAGGRATGRRSSIGSASSKRASVLPSSRSEIEPARKRQAKNAFDVLKVGRRDAVPDKGGRGAGAAAHLATVVEAPAVWYHDHWVPLHEADTFQGSLRTQKEKRKLLEKESAMMKCRCVLEQ
jgi:hypothetical protein